MQLPLLTQEKIHIKLNDFETKIKDFWRTAMYSKMLVLRFPKEVAQKPIVCFLVKDFDLIFNILNATVLPRKEGILVLELLGTRKNFRKGVEYLKEQGVIVQDAEQEVKRDKDKCIHCGACTAVCPTEALAIKRPEMTVVFDQKKCSVLPALRSGLPHEEHGSQAYEPYPLFRMKEMTAIAMSGGVDSLVAAYLLKMEGHNVIGVHFCTGFETKKIKKRADEKKRPFEIIEPTQRLTTLAQRIDIPLYFVDLSIPFKNIVVNYFIDTYKRGKTPNPCLVCNSAIKFDALRDFASKIGAVHLATGHYAKVTPGGKERFLLKKGVDPEKEQSYFLAFLTQSQLSHAVFPLGDMKKQEAVALAKNIGLYEEVEKESQDVCFVKGLTYKEFLESQIDFSLKPGEIVDVDGKVIGRHNGLHRYTIGQRRGIDCPAKEPYYVLQIDMKRNRLVVGFKKDLAVSECRVEKINWIVETPRLPFSATTRVRYRHRAAPSTVIPVTDEDAIVKFDNPQEAITPGQGAVFYDGEIALGGGWIE